MEIISSIRLSDVNKISCLWDWMSIYRYKGVKKNRGRMKLLLMRILKYYTEINNILWQYLFIVEIKLNWIDTKHTFHGRWKIIMKYFAKKNFQCVWRCPIEQTKNFFWQNTKCMLNFWCFTVKIKFSLQDQCIVCVKILNWLTNSFSWMLKKK